MTTEHQDFYKVTTQLPIAVTPLLDMEQRQTVQRLIEINHEMFELEVEHPCATHESDHLVELLLRKVDVLSEHFFASPKMTATVDICLSGGGATFNWHEAIEPRSELVLSLHLDHEHPPLYVHALVLACEPSDTSSSSYRYHCRFSPGQDQAIDAIIGYVNQLQIKALASGNNRQGSDSGRVPEQEASLGHNRDNRAPKHEDYSELLQQHTWTTACSNHHHEVAA